LRSAVLIKALTAITDIYVRDTLSFVPVPLAERGIMLIVTPIAKEKLKKALLEEQATDPEVIFRITPVHSMPNRLGIALDKENKDDQVVKSEEGTKVLLIESSLAHELEGMVLDYKKSSQGEGFKISKTSPTETCQRGEQKWWN
jgi:Fe-S cluster assembly iron-binding protein IscA